MPGGPTPGPADMHCAGMVQPTNPATCSVTDAGSGDDGGGGDAATEGGGDDSGGGDDGGAASCAYGDTLYGQESDDDDCKYHVKWTSTPICEGAAGVTFTVTATHKTDGTPLTGIPRGVGAEVFIPTSLDASCDTQSTHPSPNTGVILAENPAGSGTYSGNVIFDAPGIWTVRFHFHEECADILPDSPHGHAAYRITVP